MTRSLPRLALPHLSDEAVAAFADGVLRGAAQQRARQHLTECRDCADAVQGQRAASAVLRSASAPCLPSGLLDRLRDLPGTTALPSLLVPSGLSTDGRPVFAAFGTVPAPFASPTSPQPTLPQPTLPQPTLPQPTLPQQTTPQPTTPTQRPTLFGPPSAGFAVVSGSAGGVSGTRHRPLSAPYLTSFAAAAVAVGLLASTAGAAGGGTRARVPAGSQPAPAGSVTNNTFMTNTVVTNTAVTHTVGPLFVGPAINLGGPR